MQETKLVPEAVQNIYSKEFNSTVYDSSEELRKNWFDIEVGPEYKIETNAVNYLLFIYSFFMEEMHALISLQPA